MKTAQLQSTTTSWLLLGAVLADMLCVGLIVPLLTPFARELGASPSTIGFVSSVYGAVQLLSAPLVGKASDGLVSRRTVILFSLVGGAFGYGLLGFANTVATVIVSRMVVGVCRQTLTVSKAWLSDMGTPGTRSRDLGRFYAAVSIGFMIGPAIGGYGAKHFGYKPVFLVAAVCFLLNAAMVRTMLPDGGAAKATKGARRQSVCRCLCQACLPTYGGLCF